MDLKSFGDDALPYNHQGNTNESTVQTKDESDTLMADINAKSDDSAVRQPESLNNTYSEAPLSENNMNANNELVLLNSNQHSIETDKNSSVNIDEDSNTDVIVDDCDDRDDDKEIVNGAMSIEGEIIILSIVSLRRLSPFHSRK